VEPRREISEAREGTRGLLAANNAIEEIKVGCRRNPKEDAAPYRKTQFKRN